MTSSGGEISVPVVRSLVRLEAIEGVQTAAYLPETLLPLTPPSAVYIPAPYEGYEVNKQALVRASGKGEKSWLYTNRAKAEGYWYVSVDVVKKRLNEAYGPGIWSFFTTEAHRRSARRLQLDDSGKETESIVVTVEGWLRAPYILEPGIKGVGQGTFFPNSRRATAANTIATAESEALKSAAKFLGIGLDLKEDPAIAKTEAARKTLENIIKAMVKQPGVEDQVNKLVAKLAPEAFSKKEGIMYYMLDAEQVETVSEAVMKLAGA